MLRFKPGITRPDFIRREGYTTSEDGKRIMDEITAFQEMYPKYDRLGYRVSKNPWKKHKYKLEIIALTAGIPIHKGDYSDVYFIPEFPNDVDMSLQEYQELQLLIEQLSTRIDQIHSECTRDNSKITQWSDHVTSVICRNTSNDPGVVNECRQMSNFWINSDQTLRWIHQQIPYLSYEKLNDLMRRYEFDNDIRDAFHKVFVQFWDLYTITYNEMVKADVEYTALTFPLHITPKYEALAMIHQLFMDSQDIQDITGTHRQRNLYPRHLVEIWQSWLVVFLLIFDEFEHADNTKDLPYLLKYFDEQYYMTKKQLQKIQLQYKPIPKIQLVGLRRASDPGNYNRDIGNNTNDKKFRRRYSEFDAATVATEINPEIPLLRLVGFNPKNPYIK